MSWPQTGIFALGDAAHLFLEFSKLPGTSEHALVQAGANLHEPRTTVGGMNLVTGFRPELWRAVSPGDTPPDARGFDRPVVGPDGFTMPATQADLWLWMAGATYDILWDEGRDVIEWFKTIATLERRLTGWAYRHSRDLTGFEDGTENPSLMEAPDVALVPQDRPGAGTSGSSSAPRNKNARWAAPSATASSLRESARRRIRTYPALRTSSTGLSATSSGATCPTGTSLTTGRSSSALAASSCGLRECSNAWPAPKMGFAMR